jgi:cellobiose phosphorylase
LLALLHTRPDLTRQQILLHCAHQYREGDVQQWWHEELGRGIRTHFSDDLLWLPYVTARYVEQTGDVTLLGERVSFLESEELPVGVDERYEDTVVSDDIGSVFEHCVRAVRRSLRFGEHGLPLFGSGDWNDGMSRVGVKGRGESVWLGWFLIDVLQRFAGIAEMLGGGDVAQATTEQAEMSEETVAEKEMSEETNAETVAQAETSMETSRDAADDVTDAGGSTSASVGSKSTSAGSAAAKPFVIDGETHDWPALQTEFMAQAANLQAALEAHAWDGEWYRRAFHDDGVWLGSAQSSSCRIDAIAQSWAVISGGAAQERARAAMAQFDAQLVRRDSGIAMLLTPPFGRGDGGANGAGGVAAAAGVGTPPDAEHGGATAASAGGVAAAAGTSQGITTAYAGSSDAVAPAPTPPHEPDPGYIAAYPPGIRENGGQYTHGALWAIQAWALLGEGDKAAEIFRLLSPIAHTLTPDAVQRYAGEPYVVAADVYTAPDVYGHAGWTWYTGSSGWMYQLGLECILGITRRADTLHIDPCIPQDWPEYTVRYRCGSAVYNVRVVNPQHRSTGVSKVMLDGTALLPVPHDTAGANRPFARIPLLDDAQVHEVLVTM